MSLMAGAPRLVGVEPAVVTPGSVRRLSLRGVPLDAAGLTVTAGDGTPCVLVGGGAESQVGGQVAVAVATTGWVECAPPANVVEAAGLTNYTVAVVDARGVSTPVRVAASALRVAADGTLFQQEVVPALLSVTPRTGSAAGGALVVVAGAPAGATISFGSQPCDVLAANGTSTLCRTRPALPPDLLHHLLQSDATVTDGEHPTAPVRRRYAHALAAQGPLRNTVLTAQRLQAQGIPLAAGRLHQPVLPPSPASPAAAAATFTAAYLAPPTVPRFYGGPPGVLRLLLPRSTPGAVTAAGAATGRGASMLYSVGYAAYKAAQSLASSSMTSQVRDTPTTPAGTAATLLPVLEVTGDARPAVSPASTSTTTVAAAAAADGGVTVRADTFEVLATVFTPAITGTYTLYLAADTPARLLLTLAPQEAGMVADGTLGLDLVNLTTVATVTVPVPLRAYFLTASQASAPLTLIGGASYYLEVQHEVGGRGEAEGAHVSVAARIHSWGHASPPTAAAHDRLFAVSVSAARPALADRVTLSPAASAGFFAFDATVGGRFTRRSPLLHAAATEAAVRTALDSFLGVECDFLYEQPATGSPAWRMAWQASFEDRGAGGNWSSRGGAGLLPDAAYGGAFCGRGSLHLAEPYAASPPLSPATGGVDINAHPYLCFAARLPPTTHATLLLALNGGDTWLTVALNGGVVDTDAAPLAATATLPADGGWHHTCVHLLPRDADGSGSPAADLVARLTRSRLRVTALAVGPPLGQVDASGGALGLDEITLSSSPVTVVRRLAAEPQEDSTALAATQWAFPTLSTTAAAARDAVHSMPSDATAAWLAALDAAPIATFAVLRAAAAGSGGAMHTFDITWRMPPNPLVACGDAAATFSLRAVDLSLAPAEASGRTPARGARAKSPADAPLVTLTRISEGGAPLGGEFHLALGASAWVGVRVGASSREVARALAPAAAAAGVRVRVSGGGTCMNRTYLVSLGGGAAAGGSDNLTLRLDKSGLTGLRTAGEVRLAYPGGTLLSPMSLGGAALRVPTPGLAPLVEVRAQPAGAPTLCITPGACVHLPHPAATPVIVAVEPATATMGATVRLSGVALGPDAGAVEALRATGMAPASAGDYVVHFGGLRCAMQAATDTCILCALLPDGSDAEAHDPATAPHAPAAGWQVFVPGKGAATVLHTPATAFSLTPALLPPASASATAAAVAAAAAAGSRQTLDASDVAPTVVTVRMWAPPGAATDLTARLTLAAEPSATTTTTGSTVEVPVEVLSLTPVPDAPGIAVVRLGLPALPADARRSPATLTNRVAATGSLVLTTSAHAILRGAGVAPPPDLHDDLITVSALVRYWTSLAVPAYAARVAAVRPASLPLAGGIPLTLLLTHVAVSEVTAVVSNGGGTALGVTVGTAPCTDLAVRIKAETGAWLDVVAGVRVEDAVVPGAPLAPFFHMELRCTPPSAAAAAARPSASVAVAVRLPSGHTVLAAASATPLAYVSQVTRVDVVDVSELLNAPHLPPGVPAAGVDALAALLSWPGHDVVASAAAGRPRLVRANSGASTAAAGGSATAHDWTQLSHAELVAAVSGAMAESAPLRAAVASATTTGAAASRDVVGSLAGGRLLRLSGRGLHSRPAAPLRVTIGCGAVVAGAQAPAAAEADVLYVEADGDTAFVVEPRWDADGGVVCAPPALAARLAGGEYGARPASLFSHTAPGLPLAGVSTGDVSYTAGAGNAHGAAAAGFPAGVTVALPYTRQHNEDSFTVHALVSLRATLPKGAVLRLADSSSLPADGSAATHGQGAKSAAAPYAARGWFVGLAPSCGVVVFAVAVSRPSRHPIDPFLNDLSFPNTCTDLHTYRVHGLKAGFSVVSVPIPAAPASAWLPITALVAAGSRSQVLAVASDFSSADELVVLSATYVPNSAADRTWPLRVGAGGLALGAEGVDADAVVALDTLAVWTTPLVPTAILRLHAAAHDTTTLPITVLSATLPVPAAPTAAAPALLVSSAATPAVYATSAVHGEAALGAVLYVAGAGFMPVGVSTRRSVLPVVHVGGSLCRVLDASDVLLACVLDAGGAPNPRAAVSVYVPFKGVAVSHADMADALVADPRFAPAVASSGGSGRVLADGHDHDAAPVRAGRNHGGLSGAPLVLGVVPASTIVTPACGSVAGGATLTLVGAWGSLAGATVTVALPDASECIVRPGANASHIVCDVPPAPLAPGSPLPPPMRGDLTLTLTYPAARSVGGHVVTLRVGPYEQSATCTPVLAWDASPLLAGGVPNQRLQVHAQDAAALAAAGGSVTFLAPGGGVVGSTAALEFGSRGAVYIPVTAAAWTAATALRSRVGDAGMALHLLPGSAAAVAVVPLGRAPGVVERVYPPAAPAGGGIVAAVSGSGFDPAASELSVGGVPCPLVPAPPGTEPASSTRLYCRLPPARATTAATTDRLVAQVTHTWRTGVAAADAGAAAGTPPRAAGGNFVYHFAGSPMLTAAALDTAALTLTGRHLAATGTPVTVTVGGMPCAIRRASTDTIVCTLHAATPAGTHVPVVRLGAGADGADVWVPAHVRVVVGGRVDAVATAALGSPAGGAAIVVTGSHLPSSANVSVCGVPCDVTATAADATSLHCTLRRADVPSVPSVTTRTIALHLSTNAAGVPSAATPTGSPIRLPAAASLVASRVVLHTRRHVLGCAAVTARVACGSSSAERVVTLEACPVAATTLATAVPLLALDAASLARGEDTACTVSVDWVLAAADGKDAAAVATVAVEVDTRVDWPAAVAARAAAVAAAATAGWCTVEVAATVEGGGRLVSSAPSASAIIKAGAAAASGDAVAPSVHAVIPDVGSREGGYLVHISGTGLQCGSGGEAAAVTVTLAGVLCAVVEAHATTIICRAGPAPVPADAAALPAVATHGGVEVTCAGYGIVPPSDLRPLGLTFTYAPLWSQAASWGAGSVPAAGDAVVIPAGTTLLLDVSPPPMHSLVVRGSLVLDPRADLTLTAGAVVVAAGGELVGGSEDAPRIRSVRFAFTPLRALHAAVAHAAGAAGATLPHSGLFVLPGGRLALVGATASPVWAPLVTRMEAGDTQVHVGGAGVTWRPGSRLHLTAAGRGSVAEEVAVRAVTASGRSLWVATPVAAAHDVVITTHERHRHSVGGEAVLLDYPITLDGSAAGAAGAAVVVLAPHATSGTRSPAFTLAGAALLGLGSHRHAALSFTAVAPGAAGAWPARHARGGMAVRSVLVSHPRSDGIAIDGVHGVTVAHAAVLAASGAGVAVLRGVEQEVVLADVLVSGTRRSRVVQRHADAGFLLGSPAVAVSACRAVAGESTGFLLTSSAAAGIRLPACAATAPLRQADDLLARDNAGDGIRLSAYTPTAGGCAASSQSTVAQPVRAAMARLTSAFNKGVGLMWEGGGPLEIVEAVAIGNGGGGISMPPAPSGHLVGGRHANKLVRPLVVALALTDAADRSRSRRAAPGLALPAATGLLVDGATFIGFNDAASPAVAPCAGCDAYSAGDAGYESTFVDTRWDHSQARLGAARPDAAVIEDLDGSFAGVAGDGDALPAYLTPRGGSGADLHARCSRLPSSWNVGGVLPVVACRGLPLRRLRIAAAYPHNLRHHNMRVGLGDGLWANVPYGDGPGVDGGGWSTVVPVGSSVTLSWARNSLHFWEDVVNDPLRFAWGLDLAPGESARLAYRFQDWTGHLPSAIAIAGHDSPTMTGTTKASHGEWRLKSHLLEWVATVSGQKGLASWETFWCGSAGCGIAIGEDVTCLPGRLVIDTPTVTVAKSARAAVVRLRRVGGSCGAVTVTMAPATLPSIPLNARPGTEYYTPAAAGRDFMAGTRTVTLGDGVEVGEVAVPLVADAADITPRRRFTVTLTAVTPALVAAPEGDAATVVVDMLEDDAPSTSTARLTFASSNDAYLASNGSLRCFTRDDLVHAVVTLDMERAGNLIGTSRAVIMMGAPTTGRLALAGKPYVGAPPAGASWRPVTYTAVWQPGQRFATVAVPLAALPLWGGAEAHVIEFHVLRTEGGRFTPGATASVPFCYAGKRVTLEGTARRMASGAAATDDSVDASLPAVVAVAESLLSTRSLIAAVALVAASASSALLLWLRRWRAGSGKPATDEADYDVSTILPPSQSPPPPSSAAHPKAPFMSHAVPHWSAVPGALAASGSPCPPSSPPLSPLMTHRVIRSPSFTPAAVAGAGQDASLLPPLSPPLLPVSRVRSVSATTWLPASPAHGPTTPPLPPLPPSLLPQPAMLPGSIVQRPVAVAAAL